MKKLIAIVAVILAVAANADYLYWMVDTGDTGQGAGTYAYDTVKLVADGTAIDTITLTDMSAFSGSTVNDKLASYQNTYGLALETELTGGSYSSFLVELWNGSSWKAQSNPISYETLLASSIYKGGIGTPASSPATFGTYNVPEPTSGLLFLIGGMLLGLKRRRQA